MSDKNKENRKSKEYERHERDSSPSAYSQSSTSNVLEWDPSADVGSRIGPLDETEENVSPPVDPIRRSLSTLERIALDLATGFDQYLHTRSSRNLRNSNLTRSRSEEEAQPERNVPSSRSLRSMSMIELASFQTRAAPRVFETIQNEHQTEISSAGSVATVVTSKKPSPVQINRREESDFFDHLNVLKSNQGITSQSPPSSSAALPEHSSSPPDSSTSTSALQHLQQIELDTSNERESSEGISTAKILLDTQNLFTRVISDASTEWDYGNSRSLSHENDVSSLSEWQTSGLTKSELKYTSRRPEESSSTGTISLQLDVNQAGNEQQNEGGALKPHTGRSSLDDNIEDLGYEYEPLKPIQLDSDRRRSTRTNSKGKVAHHHRHSSVNRSPPKASKASKATQATALSSKALASSRNVDNSGHRKQRHSRHKLTGSHLPYRSDDAQTSTSRLSKRNLSRNPSDLSTTCELFLDLAKKQGPLSKSDLVEALRAHRDTHVQRFRRELDHLHTLNGALENATATHYSKPSSSSTPSSDNSLHHDEHIRRSSHQLLQNDEHIRRSSHQLIQHDEHTRRPSHQQLQHDEYIRRSSHQQSQHDEYIRRPHQPSQPDEHFRRSSQQQSQPDENVRRSSQQQSQPDEYIRRPSHQKSQPDDHVRRSSQQQSQPDENVRQSSQQQSQPDEHVRRSSQQQSSSQSQQQSQPDEHVRRSSHQQSQHDEYIRRPSQQQSQPHEHVRRSSQSQQQTQLDEHIMRSSHPQSQHYEHKSRPSHQQSQHDEHIRRPPYQKPQHGEHIRRPSQQQSEPAELIRRSSHQLLQPQASSSRHHLSSDVKIRQELVPKEKRHQDPAKRRDIPKSSRPSGIQKKMSSESTPAARSSSHSSSNSSPTRTGRMTERYSKGTQYPSSSSVSISSSKDSFSFLIDKLNILTDISILNQNFPESDASSEPSDPRFRRIEKSKISSSSKRSVSFFIPFPGCKCDWRSCGGATPADHMEQVNSRTTLREVYEKFHPETVNSMRRREQILAQMKSERETRTEIKREWFRTHSPDDLAGLAQVLPPKGERIMSSREMKELTRKKYKRLAEVKQEVLLRMNTEQKKTNRILQKHFAQKLQRTVLNGERNIPHNRSVIRE